MLYLFRNIFKNLTSIERRLFIGVGIAFIISAFFLIVNFYLKNSLIQPVEGGVLKEGMVGQPVFINPLITPFSQVDRDLTEIIYSDLDDLVKNYQVSEDNLSWTLTLKDNIFWSDGHPITADDVIFTLKIIQDPANNHPLLPTWRGVEVQRLNKNELRFTLKTPYVFLIDNFKDLKIAPQHIFGSIPPPNLRLSRYNLEPVASGPFKFARYQARDDGFITEYHLVRNERYFGDKPYLDEIVFKFYPDYQSLIQAYNQKKTNAAAGLSPTQLSNIKVSHQTLNINLPRYYAIFFNPNVNESLKDKKVRQLLNAAIDKKKIVEQIFNKQTIIVDGPLLPNINGYSHEAVNSPPEDLENKNLGIEINLVIPEIDFLIKTAKIIKKDWEKIGVKLNLIVLNPQDIQNSVLKTRNYEAILFGNILKKNPDLFSFWHSSERFYPGRNLALYANSKADQLLEEIRQDFSASSRQEKLKQLQKIINEDQPAIFLYSPIYIYIVPRHLQGFRSYFIANPSKRFEKINQWYLKSRRIIVKKRA